MITQLFLLLNYIFTFRSKIHSFPNRWRNQHWTI